MWRRNPSSSIFKFHIFYWYFHKKSLLHFLCFIFILVLFFLKLLKLECFGFSVLSLVFWAKSEYYHDFWLLWNYRFQKHYICLLFLNCKKICFFVNNINPKLLKESLSHDCSFFAVLFPFLYSRAFPSMIANISNRLICFTCFCRLIKQLAEFILKSTYYLLFLPNYFVTGCCWKKTSGKYWEKFVPFIR